MCVDKFTCNFFHIIFFLSCIFDIGHVMDQAVNRLRLTLQARFDYWPVRNGILVDKLAMG